MFEPVKVGLGEFLQGFYGQVAPTTRSLQEFVGRGFPYCFAWAPARMVDLAGDMLAAWQRNDTGQAPTRPPKLPAVLVAVAKDYTPTGRDFTTQIADPVDVMIPGDDKARYFQMKLVAGDVRAQVAIAASDEPTAKSLAAQFLLYLDSPSRRAFSARYPFAGIDHEFPVQIEAPDNPAMNIETGSKNVTMLAIDLTLKCSVPLFLAPGEGEPNDGKGVPGTADPAGFPLVEEINRTEHEVR
ncbi:hypothetical protein D3C76_355620 [compost metagenome]